MSDLSLPKLAAVRARPGPQFPSVSPAVATGPSAVAGLPKASAAEKRIACIRTIETAGNLMNEVQDVLMGRTPRGSGPLNTEEVGRQVAKLNTARNLLEAVLSDCGGVVTDQEIKNVEGMIGAADQLEGEVREAGNATNGSMEAVRERVAVIAIGIAVLFKALVDGLRSAPSSGPV